MKKFPLFVSMLLPALAAAQQVPEFSADRFRAHVEFLADDLLEGRESGTRGYDIAAQYVASQFAAAGLKPAGDDGGWLQQVTMQKVVRGANRGSITLTGPKGANTFAHADDVLVGLHPVESAVEVDAPLVFVGYGLEDRRFGLDDYRGLDVRGKVVVALRGYPKGLPSEEGAHLNANKGKLAQRHGAVGLVHIATLQWEKTVPWRQMLEYAEDPAYYWVGPDDKPHDEAPGIRARATFNAPAAELLFAGAKRSFADLRAEADREGGKPRGFALRTRLKLSVSGEATRIRSANVVGVLPGSDAKLAAEHVALLAHLDHLGIKKAGGKEQVHPGALDNASGIATLLEVARAAASATDKPRRSMLFLATTAEEKGLLGAAYFARHPTVPIRQIVGNVGLDMPLLLYPFDDVIAFGANHSTLGRIVEQAVAPMNVKLGPDPMPEQGIFTRSDHYEFVRQGVPAVFLVTGFGNGGAKFWGEFLGGAYHSPRDNLAQKIDWSAAARFAEANYRITRAMADTDEPPLWYSGDYFGDTFAPDAGRARR